MQPMMAGGGEQRTPEGWLYCPNCGSDAISMPGYTWWGGVVGPKMLTHVRCGACGNTYNGKSGKSNTPAIVIYQVVAIVLAIIIFAVIANM